MFEHLRPDFSPLKIVVTMSFILKNEAGTSLSNLSRSNSNKTMKKRRQFIAPLGTIMKVSFIQIMLAFVAVTYTYGHVVKAQELLLQKVDVNVEQKEIRAVLSQLESMARVKFVYSSRSLPVERKVSLSLSNKTVSEVLDAMFRPDRVTYKIVKERIILTMVNSSSILPDPQPEIEKGILEKTIKGKVTDDKKEPLPGVNITIKGSARGTSTDLDGNFTLQIPDEPVVLVFSFVGFLPQEVSPGNSGQLSVTLNVDTKSLEEVVVVGYGERQRETLTGAISQVGEEVFKDRSVPNATLALQGEVPGLTITRTSSRPGNESLNIRLRGESSVTGVSPLIIIDGVPTLGDWELSQINPADIQSVTALKDASAAIYGARAQGGVILITTKRGKGSKMQINYNANVRLNTIGINVPWANMSQWAKLFLETSVQDKVDATTGQPVEWFPQWTKDNLIRMANNESFDFTNPSGVVTHYADNNWQKALYQPAVSSQHNLGIRGATDKTAYSFSLGYSNDKSILKTAYDGEKKYTARFNYDYNITNKIKLETGLSFDNRTVESPKNGIGAGFFDAPIFPVYNSKGDYYDDYGYRNPVASTTSGGTTKNSEGIVRLNTKLSAEIIDGLKISATAAVVKRDGWKKEYNQTYNLYSWLGDRINSVQNATPSIGETIGNTLYQTYGAFIDYNKTIARDHNFSVLLGNTAELSESKGVTANRTNLEYAGLYTLNTANSVTQTNSGTASHWGLVSYVGRFNYDYKKKILFEILGRRDGSSRFADGYKWSDFYGLSGGWRISQESFMKNIRVINDLKIRGSYGETGGQAGLGNYDYVSTITTTGTALFGTVPAVQGAAYLSGITTSQRNWERMVNKDLGLDFTMFDNHLTGSFDLYEKKNVGMLVALVYPTVLGGTAPATNNGTFSTKGWELALGWKGTANKVTYNIGFQLSNNKNKVLSYAGANSWAAGKYTTPREGYALNSIYVYQTDGYFKSQEEVTDYYTKYTATATGNLAAMSGATGRLRPGDLKVVDRDGNGVLNATGNGTTGSGDVYFYGDADAHYTFGVNMGVNWKGFDFSAFIQGVGKQNILRGGNARAPFFRNYLNVNNSYAGKTWTPENTEAEYPRLSFDANRNNWNWQTNDVNIQQLRYARLKSLIIGYSLPKELISKLKTQRVRLYFSGNDLFEFTSVKDGFDPERGESSDSSYPFIRTWSFGLDISF